VIVRGSLQEPIFHESEIMALDIGIRPIVEKIPGKLPILWLSEY
jgi:hypothetical protein